MTEEKQNGINDFIKEKKCRKFDPMITKQQIYAGNSKWVACWGADDWARINDDALVFTVNGFLHKGFVIITLNFWDTYDVHLFNHDGDQVGETKTDIYFDRLVYVIDELVETPKK